MGKGIKAEPGQLSPTKEKKKMRKAILFSIILMLAMTSTTMQIGSVRGQNTTFTVGWAAATMDTLNPTAMTLADGGAYNVIHAIYDTLVRSDENGSPIPGLSVSWTYKDPTTVDFQLVHNATWHDGTPFTSDDVVFTINLFLAHKEFPLMRTYVQTMKSVQALDKYSIEIVTTKPDATLMDFRLFGLIILPKHIWEPIANYTTYTNDNPIGTGPFKFVKWGGPNTFVQFDANTNYFNGSPKFDHLVLRYFTSYNAMALAIQSGEIDYAGPLFTPALVPTLTSASGVQVITRPDPRYYYFDFNAYPGGSGNPALRDKNVRIALSHAIDNVALSQVVWAGFALPQNTTIPLALGDWVNPNTPSYAFDLKLAAQMLDAAGYKVGSDGVRVGPNGVRLALKIEVPSNYAEEYRAAQTIANWWKQIGVDATPMITEIGAFADNSVNWKFDTYIWVWSAGATLDPDWFVSMFQSTEAQPAPNPGLSDSGMSNSTYDALYQLQISQTDPNQRRQTIWKMQDIIHQEAAYVGLYDPLAVQAFRSDRFMGIPAGKLPPLNQFATNNLLLKIGPLSAPVATSQTMATSMTESTTAAPAMGMSTETLTALVVAVVLIIAVVAFAAKRRKSPPKGR